MEQLNLTAVVLTYNEAPRIRNCLEHLGWADEILVLDSGSDDGTAEICSTWPKTRVLRRPFEDFASQRNAAVEAVREGWVLMVDADEEVSLELAREVREALQSGCDAYWIPRRNVIFGRPLHFGECLGDEVGRLFRKGKAHYTGSIHEVLVAQGRSGRLRNHLLHHSFESVSGWMRKMDRYTSEEARRFVAEGRRFRWIPVLLGPWGRFLKFYLWRQGWRDGWHGFVYAALGSFYFFVKHLKLKECSWSGARSGKFLGSRS